MPSCKDVTRLIASDELERQPWHRRLGVRVHLGMCRHCSAYAAQIRAIGRSVRGLYASSGVGSLADELVEILKKR